MDSEEQQTSVPATQLSAEEVDVEILPLIYEIIRSIERDPHDATQKPRESQDTAQKILELQKKLDQAREQVKRLPGVDLSREEQLKRLEFMRTQLRLKRELLLKYRTTCTFEIPPSTTGNSNSFSSPLSSTQQQQQINTNSLPTSNAQPIVNNTGKA
ncbi:mediator of RNA polymerase II transcription subunit 9 [Ischnura elegans]|uniref:mediator of RNA polymerase II transcription subunit 9 n=1 Tax=Ischnura elegans TaxID=197161 RepID=UPI001ED8A9D3|nr:mediator of RNA polymerase II transcription subunit 9 [Ischnura elegans]